MAEMTNYTVQGPDGVQHVINGPAGASDDEVIAQAQQLFSPSKLESFGRGVENNFPLANQAIAAGSAAIGDKDYSQNLAEQNAAIKGAKAANPISYDAGAVTGAVAPALIPGVGEAMAAAPVASGAALGAANAIGNTDLEQNPGEAAKQAGEGALLGGTIGKILPTGSGLSSDLESYANKKGVQALNLKPGMLGIPEDELEALGAKAHELDLVEGSTPERAAKAQDLLHQVGAQIQDIGGGSQPLQDPASFVDALHGHLQESADIYGPEANPEATIYRQGIANLQQPGLTFDRLQQLKSAYGNRAFDAMGDVKNEAAANVYRQIKDAMKSIVDGSPEQYQDLMNQYSDLKDISSGLQTQLGKEQASGVQAKGFGMVGKLAGALEGNNPVVNTATAGGLAAMGHPMMAVGALTPMMGNPGAISGIARSAGETAIPAIANTARAGTIDAMVSHFISNPQSYGRYSTPLMQALQQGGKQQFAATSFVMRSQYPELNDMMMGKQEDASDAQ